ncbi:MAG: hypothetical protein AB7P23_09265, partial [Amphiplicatus sp.]
PMQEDLPIGSFAINPTDQSSAVHAFNQLRKYNLADRKLLQTAELAHTYYQINFSSDGARIFLGGASNDISVYAADELKRIKTIQIPGGFTQGGAWLPVIRRVEVVGQRAKAQEQSL